MNKRPTAKDLCTQAAALLDEGITTREKFEAALPLMMESNAAAAGMKSLASSLTQVAKNLSEAAACYAKDHKTALGEGLREVRGGIFSAQGEINGVTYRLTVSRGDLKRITGDSMTQEFLEGLPEGWTRTKVELDKTTIGKFPEEELQQAGLVREVKNEWKVVDTAA